jgi:Domain of unknown function (DUF4153)
LNILKNISSFFNQLGISIKRFPLSIICAVTACVLFIIANHLTYAPQTALVKSSLIRLAIESMAGISLFYSFHIYSENKDLDWAKRIGFIILGFCLLGLHFYSIPSDIYNFGINYTLRYAIIIFCFHLIISFSLYNQQQELEAFWQYNEFLFVRFITTLLFTLVLFVGIAGGMWAVDVLFGIDIHEKYYLDVLATMLFIFNTFFFLNTVPIDTHYFEREKKYQNALRVFVQFILIPIVILYGTILTIYLGKILLTHVLPKGWVAVPILIFSGIGILTYLLAYPIRNTKNDIIHLFCKYFFHIMLPFLTLYFSSLVKRIANYGFTEERYMALALGIWLVFISIYIISSKLDNIIFIPVSLCILLAMASFGPWGMYKFSATNQYYRLVNILENNKMLVDGKITSTNKNKMNRNDSKQINSIVSYLYTHNEIDKIKKLLNTKDAMQLDKLVKEGFDERNVGNLLGVSGTGLKGSNEVVNYFTCNTTNYGLANLPLPTNGHQKILEFYALDYAANDIEMSITDTNNYYTILNNNNLYVIFKSDTVLQENLKEHTLYMKSLVLQSIGDTSFFNKTINKITIPFRQQYYSRDSMKLITAQATYYINEIKCLQTQKETKAISMNGYAIF